MVYGVALMPRVGPTAWALLALLDQCDRPENRKSLDWLAAAFPKIQGPGSLALAHLCLQAYCLPESGESKIEIGNAKLETRNSTIENGNSYFSSNLRISNFDLEALLRGQQAVNQFLMNVVVVAWVTIALSGVPDWLSRIKVKGERRRR